MKKNITLLFLFFIINLLPFGVFSADEQNPAVSNVLNDYYGEFVQMPEASDKNHDFDTTHPTIENSLVNYYSEFLK